jgi:hypothetical protein
VNAEPGACASGSDFRRRKDVSLDQALCSTGGYDGGYDRFVMSRIRLREGMA